MIKLSEADTQRADRPRAKPLTSVNQATNANF